MRGKEAEKGGLILRFRITPAYAGKSRCENARLCGGQDHPRLCGEKRTFRHGKAVADGSPPPMRGKAGMCLIIFASIGITPAYAGKRHYYLYIYYII